jgi:hypothetical protein
MNLHDDGDTETLTWKELEDGKRLFKQSSSKKCPVRFRSALSKLPSTVLGQILNKRFRMTNTDDGTYRCENDTMNGPRSSYWNSKVCTECHDLGRHRQDITNVKIEQFNNCLECQQLNNHIEFVCANFNLTNWNNRNSCTSCGDTNARRQNLCTASSLALFRSIVAPHISQNIKMEVHNGNGILKTPNKSCRPHKKRVRFATTTVTTIGTLVTDTGDSDSDACSRCTIEIEGRPQSSRLAKRFRATGDNVYQCKNVATVRRGKKNKEKGIGICSMCHLMLLALERSCRRNNVAASPGSSNSMTNRER